MNASFTTPVLLLVFNRSEVTKRVFEQIRKVRPKNLFIAADGPRSNVPGDREKCRLVRESVSRIDWDCEVKRLYRDGNLGCKRAISGAIDWFFAHVNEGIILEDDCIPAPSFFPFCEELLEHYRDDRRIMMISGLNAVATCEIESSYLFSIYGSICGWATWRRAWDCMDVDMNLWPKAKESDVLESTLVNEYPPVLRRRLFDKCYRGEIDSWGYPWLFARIIQNGLSIVPRVNLISNIGFGQDATHTKKGNHPGANLPLEDITFPLKHPDFIVPNVEFDRILYRKFSSVPKRIYMFVRRAISFR